MKRVRQLVSFGILLGFFAAGEAVSELLHLPVPGSVLGMVLLAGVLMLGWLRLEWVAPASDALLSQLGLLFVPPAVAVMLYFELILAEWLPLLIGTVGSLLAVLWTTALTARLLEKRDAAEGAGT